MSDKKSQTAAEEEGIPSYLSRLTQAPLLTAEEEKELTRAARKGCTESRRRLIESNMRLVINIAKSYHSRQIPLEDLIQEGAIGLMHAAERFDPDKGFRFSTYATHWIRQSIGRAIDNKAKAIRIPAHISQTLRKIERTRMQLLEDTGQEPSLDQIARELGLSTKRLQALFQASQELLSLDMRVGDKESTTLGAMIQDDSAKDPEAQVLSAEVIEELHEIMMELNERERKVITRRLRAHNPHSGQFRKELSEEMEMSRDMVRQIEVQAIRKLRQVAHMRRLKELLSDS